MGLLHSRKKTDEVPCRNPGVVPECPGNPEMADTASLASDLLTPEEVGQRLRVANVTLRKWRLTGRGPRFVRCGSRVRYRSDHVECWVDQRTVSSTSAPLAVVDDGSEGR